jgi:AraC-like DNA-binding protein
MVIQTTFLPAGNAAETQAPQDVPVTTISVSDVRQWQEVASSSFVPLQCRGFGTDFSASIDIRQISPFLSLARVQTGSVLVQRTKRLASSSENDDLLLTLQLASFGRLSQYGRTAELEPGSAVLYETNEPYEIENREPDQHQLVARIKRSALRLSPSTISAACARAISPADPSLRIYTSYVSALCEDAERLAPHARQELAEITADLITSLLRSQWTMQPGLEGRGEELLVHMKAFVLENLGNPGLDVDALARAHHVSRRNVYELFGRIGESPASYIRKSRVQKAAALLGDPGAGQLKVSSIAADCGFLDPTTFTRSFRREYGMTPVEWKSGQQPGQTSGF